MTTKNVSYNGMYYFNHVLLAVIQHLLFFYKFCSDNTHAQSEVKVFQSSITFSNFHDHLWKYTVYNAKSGKKKYYTIFCNSRWMNIVVFYNWHVYLLLVLKIVKTLLNGQTFIELKDNKVVTCFVLK